MNLVNASGPMPDRTNPHHLNQDQLAARWGISPRTLERWRWLGVGPQYLKLGARVIYRAADIEAYEAHQLRATLTPEQEYNQKIKDLGGYA